MVTDTELVNVLCMKWGTKYPQTTSTDFTQWLHAIWRALFALFVSPKMAWV